MNWTVLRQIAHPVFPYRAFDVVSEVGHPVRRPHQRRALPCHCVGKPHTVGGPAERDVLARRRWLVGHRGLRRRARMAVRGEGGHELVAAATDGPDEPLRFTIVAERTAGGLDTARQRGLGDEAPTPHRIEQFLFRHESVGVAHQLGQHVEHLGLDSDDLAISAQFVALGVEHEILEPPHAGRGGRGRRLRC